MLKEFFRDKSAARLLLIAASVLLFVSQFFKYFDDAGNSFMTFGPDFSSTTVHIDVSSRGVATGWQLHPQAYLILVALAFALLRDDIADTKWFGRFGYWMALILVLVATSPGAPFRATGAGMGMVSFLMALAAALMNMFGRKSVPPPLK